jgi:CheY-like chemotaxis protein
VVELPLVAAAGPAPAGAPSEALAAAKPMAPSPVAGQVLVLDDERMIGDLLGEILKVLGHQPTVCHSALQALEWIEQRDFDLVLSDIRMPVMDGRQFYAAVCQKKPALASRIVFLTGDLVNEDTQVFLKSTGNTHLAKPFQVASVKQVVEQLLAGPPPP